MSPVGYPDDGYRAFVSLPGVMSVPQAVLGNAGRSDAQALMCFLYVCGWFFVT